MLDRRAWLAFDIHSKCVQWRYGQGSVQTSGFHPHHVHSDTVMLEKERAFPKPLPQWIEAYNDLKCLCML